MQTSRGGAQDAWLLPRLPLARALVWVGFWLVLIALLFCLDDRIAGWAEVLRLHLFRAGDTPRVLRDAFQLYGKGAGTALAAALVLLWDRRPTRAIALVLVTLSVTGTVAVVKGLSGRERPGAMMREAGQFETSFEGLSRGWADPDHRSFPSGHTAAAASNTVALNLFFPRLAPLTWALTVGVAGERIFDEKHFPSDTAAAILIAWVQGRWILRRRRFQRLCERLAQLLSRGAGWLRFTVDRRRGGEREEQKG